MLNIVLVEPEIPQNTGNVARTCAATGSRLHLVRPFGFEITDKHLKRAGLDYWHLVEIFYYDSFQEVLDKFSPSHNFWFFSTKAAIRKSFPIRGFPRVRQGNQGIGRKTSRRALRKLRAPSNDGREPFAQSGKLRLRGRLRGFAPAFFPRSQVRGGNPEKVNFFAPEFAFSAQIDLTKGGKFTTISRERK